ncbi:hypothetical protein Ahy_B05g078944 isoform A [Arachis hypogaea]|uniref:SWIM-type domain-containing protein n=1 Tax=Arachis hypogaea TaxID=3818 RepID=A0A444Z8L7_ARAHY|nr:hypothetical protein Ahy_B05g078944 isoform A [Arachis hypogaea]
MWRAAKCTYLAAWEKELMKIRAISEGAYRHLIGILIRGRDKFVADLLKKECTCRKFQMTGLPCPHAVSAINCAKDDIRKYVASCYTKAAYVACYTP